MIYKLSKTFTLGIWSHLYPKFASGPLETKTSF